MVIEMNKDIEQYKETLAMGLTTKQFVFSFASIISGGGIVPVSYTHLDVYKRQK